MDKRAMDIAAKVMDDYAKACGRKDVDALMGMFAPEEDIVNIGTQGDEWWVGREALRRGFERMFAEAENITVRYKDITEASAGPVCWFSAKVTFGMTVEGRRMEITGRNTGVLVERGKKWLIAQSHFSMPAPGAVGSSIPRAA